MTVAFTHAAGNVASRRRPWGMTVPEAHFLVIDNQYYAVSDEGLRETQQTVLRAAREGGAFVRLGPDGQHVDVLVTPSTPVRVEHAIVADEPRPDDRPAETAGSGQADVDVEWWVDSA
jgi:hypothetical protein